MALPRASDVSLSRRRRRADGMQLGLLTSLSKASTYILLFRQQHLFRSSSSNRDGSSPSCLNHDSPQSHISLDRIRLNLRPSNRLSDDSQKRQLSRAD